MSIVEIRFQAPNVSMAFNASPEHAKEIVDWMLYQSVKASTDEKLQEQPENAP